MADIKISELTALASTAIDVSADVFAVVDTSVPQTKKLSVENVLAPIVINKASAIITNLGTVTTADINGGTWAGAIDGAWTASGVTCANLGTVSAATSITSTAFVGAIDGVIGGNTPAAGTFTTIDVNSSPLSFSGAATIDTSGNNLLTIDGGTAGVRVNNLIGINSAPVTDALVYWAGALPSGGTTQYAILIDGTSSSSATTKYSAISLTAKSAAASYTVTNLRGIHVADADLGSDSTITTATGINIAGQTKGGTNNYGLHIDAPSGGSGNNHSIFVTGGVSRFDGNVGIGVAAPDHQLEVSFSDTTAVTAANIASNAISGIHIATQGNDTNAGGVLKFSQASDGLNAAIAAEQVSSSSNELVFYTELSTNFAERMRITAGDVKITTGNLVIGTAGKGIDFEDTGGTARILDDYEEGTFTPALSYQNASGVTLDYATDGYQIGRYTKIGNVVHCRFSIQVDISGSPVNDNISIAGFPFTSQNVANMEGTAIADQINITGKANYALSFSMNSTQAGLILTNITGNQGDDIGTGDNMRFNGGVSYLAA